MKYLQLFPVKVDQLASIAPVEFPTYIVGFVDTLFVYSARYFLVDDIGAVSCRVQGIYQPSKLRERVSMNATYVRASQFPMPGILYVIDGAGSKAGGNRINSLTLESFQSALLRMWVFWGVRWLCVWPCVDAFRMILNL